MRSLLFFYRSTSFIGGGAKLFINLNGESLTLYPWTEHKVILQPGTHVITKDRGTDLIGMPMNLGLLKESLTFVVNDGESIKIGVSFNNPFVFDRLNSSGGLINRNPMYAASDARRGAPDRIVGRMASPPAEQSTQTEPPRSTLLLNAAASQPDANGVVTLTISTNSDTASLKVNGDEAGGRSDGRYTVKRFAQVGDNTPEHEELMRRLTSRPGKEIPDHIIASMISSFEMPTEDEGFKEIWYAT